MSEGESMSGYHCGKNGFVLCFVLDRLVGVFVDFAWKLCLQELIELIKVEFEHNCFALLLYRS